MLHCSNTFRNASTFATLHKYTNTTSLNAIHNTGKYNAMQSTRLQAGEYNSQYSAMQCNAVYWTPGRGMQTTQGNTMKLLVDN